MALLRGTLDVLVLKALSWGPMDGFEITAWLEERSSGRLTIVDAALLQGLHRMEARDLITAEWGVCGPDAGSARPVRRSNDNGWGALVTSPNARG